MLGWIGALMVLVHSGLHFNAWRLWAALLSMPIVVACHTSGGEHGEGGVKTSSAPGV